jgi:FKBP-type peptidyl-prolyl cis-trans isomerase SlyD
MARLSDMGLCDDPRMHITDPCVVSLRWQLADGQGRPIDEQAEPLEFFVGGSDLLPKIEEALLGQGEGFEVDLHLEPEMSFGDYQADLVCFEARSLFPAELEAGMVLEGLPPGSVTPDMPTDAVYVVTEVYTSHVVLDGNHPLAGMSLRLHVKVCGVRAALADELAARSVAGGMLSVLGATVAPAVQKH